MGGENNKYVRVCTTEYGNFIYGVCTAYLSAKSQSFTSQ